MTIAAGLVSRDGLVFSATPLRSIGPNVDIERIRAYSMEDGAAVLVFAFTGHSDYALMAIQNSVESIYRIASADLTPEKVRDRIQETLVDINTLISGFPEPEQKSLSFDFLVGVHCGQKRGSQTARLFVTNRTAIREVESVACIGESAPFALCLLADHEGDYGTSEALSLSTRMLTILKHLDGGGGLPSQVLVLAHNGTVIPQPAPITTSAESHLRQVERLNVNSLSWIGDSSVPDTEFEIQLDRYGKAMREIRTKWLDSISRAGDVVR